LPGQIDDSILEMWEGFRDSRVRERVLACAASLADRDFSVVPVPTASEANRCILSMVPLHKTVFYWDAAALDELGIISTLEARGNSLKSAMALARGTGSRRRSRVPNRSIYLSTVCAVTTDGMLVKVEPELLPVFGPGRVPDSMVLVAGFNQIVDGLDEAFRRAKDTCVPQCAKRLGLDAECAKSERCVECAEPPAMCAVNTVVTRRPGSPEIAVVLIGERMGR
jgi:hypothetical protein